jgi:2-polyprenyl-3-methyl-5-hydroxy-6-metoxy-1,4-benzoquinol methylase
MSFASRSSQPELLDLPGHDFAAIRQNMAELDTINTWLGGHAITLAGFRSLAPEKRNLLVCEIGCGGGDNLAAIRRWALKNGWTLEYSGIDINPDCIEYARTRFPEATYYCCDYRSMHFQRLPDIIFSSLFCHHFTNEDLVGQLKWMAEHSREGFFINDLHRHPIAYYAIRGLTALFSRSYLVKNDAPLSVQRGFKRTELEQLIQEAGLDKSTLQWKWAFRWLVTVRH